MKDYLEKLLSELPAYMSIFSVGLVQPAKMINELSASENDSDLASRGLRFFIFSSLIVLLITYALPEYAAQQIIPSTDSEIFGVMSNLVIEVVTVTATCIVIWMAFKVVGHTVDVRRFVGLYTHFAGIALVVMALVHGVTGIAKIDPSVARSHAEAEAAMIAVMPYQGRFMEIRDSLEAGIPLSQSDSVTQVLRASWDRASKARTSLESNPVYVLVITIVFLLSLLVDCWLVVVGYAYAKRNAVSAGRYSIVVIVSLLCMAIVKTAMSGAAFGSQMYRGLQ